ncbi:MAG: 16S rRNA (guanine(966)-N(2))-methyltransferase RsmD [Clostridia bacterium]|nr:16S rRNA (guanine(966)-N(2))-methyltransferase RsmD [Clostridia bacterium]
MRIISGKYRGVTIPSPKEDIVRPTLDRVKENIFNILQFKVTNSLCLDLFCGSGAFGLECLSRNAQNVDFVDNNKNNISALKKFLEKLNAKNFMLHNCGFFDALKNFSNDKKCFDIIFLDPPFDSNFANIAIQKIFKLNLLSKDGVIIWEHENNVKNDYAFKVFDTRTYGRIVIDFLSNKV